MSRYEQEIAKRYRQQGWNVFHNGLPDFLCVKDGGLMFVEVKSSVDKVRPHQQQAIDALRACGIAVVIEEEVEESFTPARFSYHGFHLITTEHVIKLQKNARISLSKPFAEEMGSGRRTISPSSRSAASRTALWRLNSEIMMRRKMLESLHQFRCGQTSTVTFLRKKP